MSTSPLLEEKSPLDRSDSDRSSWWRTYVTDVRRDSDAESEAYRAVTPESTAARNVAVVLIVTAVALTLNQFLSQRTQPDWIITLLEGIGLNGAAERLGSALTTSSQAAFNQWAFWAFVQIAGYVVLPVLAIKFIFKAKVADFGLSAPHIRDLPIYVVLAAVVLPLVVLVSFTGPFQAKYPFFSPASGESLWPLMPAWWALYAAQFVALEFFFRGFMVHGLKGRFGFAAVFVMIVPYNMIHFGKPMLEAFGAIGGGLALGTLSLKSRSIWLGAGLHILIAGTMDVLALWHAGRIF